jgi:hypothetical protein
VSPTPAASPCAACGTARGGGAAFVFQTPEGTIVKCRRCALRHRPMLKRSLAVAVVVGSLLLIINQGDVLLSAEWPHALLWKIPLTYLVPFLVATWGALVNSRARRAVWKRPQMR